MNQKPIIKFDEEKHQYSIDGWIIPSVSQILGATKFRGKYADIDPEVLKNKAQFGTNVHKAIEVGSAKGLTPEEQHCYMQWLQIKKRYEIQPIAQEIMVVFYNERTNTYDYCGTFDLIAMFKHKPSQPHTLGVGDYKTTAILDRNYLGWQMTMYALPLMQNPGWYGLDDDAEIETLNGIWLPKKRVGKLQVVVAKAEEDVYELLEQYYKRNPRVRIDDGNPEPKPKTKPKASSAVKKPRTKTVKTEQPKSRRKRFT